MKTLYKISFLLVAVFTFSGCMAGRPMATNNISQGEPRVSIDLFYQSLSPYGRWMSYGRYGQVWVPRVARNFRPYATNGHWVYSGYGWTWISSYQWGWAPFHYGRWTFDNYYGWIWIPGTVWAPAWVAWRHSSSYYGWAPLGPGMNINININIPSRYWTFMPGRYMGYRNIHRYYRPWRQNTTIIHNTTIINNIYEQHNHHYFSGPTRRAVQQRTHRDIRPVRVFNGSAPSESRLTSNGLRIYRPTISREGREQGSGEHRARPVSVNRSTNAGRAQDRTEARERSNRPSSERTNESRNNRRTKAKRPTRNDSRSRQSEEQSRTRQARRDDGNRIDRSSNTRTRSQRRTPTRSNERKVQRQRQQPQQRSVQRQRPQSRNSVQRHQTSQRSTGRNSRPTSSQSVRRSSRTSTDRSAPETTRRTTTRRSRR